MQLWPDYQEKILAEKNEENKMLEFVKSFKYRKSSFSQCGEDLIVDFIFSAKGVLRPTYIDIGAHHPYYLSNSAYFYGKGCTGVNIEPDPNLFTELFKARKKDINLNIGIGTQKGVLDFYLISPPTMNTFSKDVADKLVSEHGMSIRKIHPVPVETLPDIINQNCNGKFPDFLSLDVEGLDYEILTTINYKDTYPKVICVETLSYSTIGRGIKDGCIINFLLDQNYILYADTYINSIFISKSFWEL